MSLHFPTWLQRINDVPLELIPTLPYASVEKAPCRGIAVQATDLSASARPDGHLAFEQATFEIPCGCRAALIGPNGSGKSTVLRVLAGLIKPRSGKVQVLGSPPALGRSRVAYLSQRPTFTENFPLQLRRLVQMGTYAHHGWFEECHHGNQEVNRALDLMGLTDLADRPVHTLSGGQLQRGLLARYIRFQGASSNAACWLGPPCKAPKSSCSTNLLRPWIKRVAISSRNFFSTKVTPSRLSWPRTTRPTRVGLIVFWK
ncbi:MAG: ATP-binding cassette domain-containing protein [Verrucomicrobia bacterium]|nr:ATP-binding cassette domain-containing protein [Verrucomicrobiota bacterium]